MSTDRRPAEISVEEWAATPVAVRVLVLALQAENARLQATISYASWLGSMWCRVRRRACPDSLL